jgi:hypothetical protein
LIEFTAVSSIKPPLYVDRFRLFFSCVNLAPLTFPKTSCAFHPTPFSPNAASYVMSQLPFCPNHSSFFTRWNGWFGPFFAGTDFAFFAKSGTFSDTFAGSGVEAFAFFLAGSSSSSLLLLFLIW